MNKQLLSLCLLFSTAVSTHIHAFKSLPELLKHEQIANVVPELADSTQKAMFESSMQKAIEAYEQLQKKYGDSTTKLLEQQMHDSFQSFLRSAINGNADEKALETFLTAFGQLKEHLKENEISDVELIQFPFILFVIRSTVARLELFLDNPDLFAQAQEKEEEINKSCSQIIEKLVAQIFVPQDKE